MAEVCWVHTGWGLKPPLHFPLHNTPHFWLRVSVFRMPTYDCHWVLFKYRHGHPKPVWQIYWIALRWPE